MPAVSAHNLILAIIAAFHECSATAVYLSAGSRNPRRFIIQTNADAFEVWIYIWTLTHGGGAARPASEYRIQITGVSSPLNLSPTGGPTLLLGYEPDTGCFAGFDVKKHFTFSTNSPSIQIPITAINDALQNGLSFAQKGNDEIVVGIRPDNLLTYTVNASVLHEQGAYAEMISLLTKAVELEDIGQEAFGQLEPDRQRIISTVSRISRNASFRQKVVTAYDRRCAVTRMQLGLIDAAHILPVGVEGSTDEVKNGLCLSPTYHRAFDRALIYLDESYTIRLNPEKVDDLRNQQLLGGLNHFKFHLDQKIHMPADKSQWPDIGMIQRANQVREILKR